MEKDTYRVYIDPDYEKEITSDELRELDLVCYSAEERKYHLLYNGKSYDIQVLPESEDGRTQLKINGVLYRTEVKDKWDKLIVKLGLDKKASHKVNELLAPMPGLIKSVLVDVGDSVEEGQTLISIEAMKMENQLKATGEGVVQSINIDNGEVVQKNQLLITFE